MTLTFSSYCFCSSGLPRRYQIFLVFLNVLFVWRTASACASRFFIRSSLAISSLRKSGSPGRIPCLISSLITRSLGVFAAALVYPSSRLLENSDGSYSNEEGDKLSGNKRKMFTTTRRTAAAATALYALLCIVVSSTQAITTIGVVNKH